MGLRRLARWIGSGDLEPIPGLPDLSSPPLQAPRSVANDWVNHKMDAPSAAIAKVVVVHVLQTRLCIYVCTLQAFCIIWNSG